MDFQVGRILELPAASIARVLSLFHVILQMDFQTVAMHEALAALFAPEAPVSRVNPQMKFESLFRRKLLVTREAAVHLLPTMQSQMLFVFLVLPVLFGTFVAGEHLGNPLGMISQMSVQIRIISESLVTHVATEWFLTCVDPHVILEASVMSELLPALTAFVRFLTGVCERVSVKIRFQSTRIITLRARIWLFS